MMNAYLLFFRYIQSIIFQFISHHFTISTKYDPSPLIGPCIIIQDLRLWYCKQLSKSGEKYGSYTLTFIIAKDVSFRI